jgi:hypothetical protein
VANVAGKIKTEHPTWNLPERRVNKLVNRYLSERENNPSATDDEDAPIDKKPRSKKFTSPSKSFRRFFSAKGKKKDVSAVAEDLGTTTSDAPPIASESDQVDIVENDHSVKKEEKSDSVEEENLDKQNAYETDNETENSSNVCFAICPIM